MIQLPNNLSAIGQSTCWSPANLWRLERTDGTVLRFCDRDAAIEYEGETYAPAGAFSASAREMSDGFKTRNGELRGVIDSDVVTEADLRAGRYIDAQVTQYLVDARFPFAGALMTTRFTILDVTHDGLGWTAQVADVSRRLRVKTGALVTRDCEYNLGDARCKKVLTSFTTSAVAVTTVDAARTRWRASAVPNSSDDWYTYGKVTWVTGSNAGLVSEVSDYVNSTRRFTSRLALPFDVEVGDTFVAVAGCDRLFETCKTKFENGDNFGGFPHVPGTEKLMNTPNSK